MSENQWIDAAAIQTEVTVGGHCDRKEQSLNKDGAGSEGLVKENEEGTLPRGRLGWAPQTAKSRTTLGLRLGRSGAAVDMLRAAWLSLAMVTLHLW